MNDTVSVKLQKRYYTVEQVAERWKCSVDDINHLIEIGAIETAHKGAARFGKKHIQLIPCETEREAQRIMTEPSAPEEGIIDVPVVIKVGGIFYGEEVALSAEQKRMMAAGHFDLVITADEVRRYERDNPVQVEKTLGTTERNTLLVIIAALCKETRLDWRKGAGAPANIVRMADELGIKISEDTIRTHLDKIDDAIEARQQG